MYQDQEFGEQLRDWRQRRRLSQLDLAAEADLSTRHLSFVETGRAKPSREMVLRLADALELPLRSRNALLIAGRLRAELSRAAARRCRAGRGAAAGPAHPRRAHAVPGAGGRPPLAFGDATTRRRAR